MGFNINTRSTNNLSGSKEIDSIGNDLVNLSSSLGNSNSDSDKAFAWLTLNDDAGPSSNNLNFGKGSVLSGPISATTRASQSMIIDHVGQDVQDGLVPDGGVKIFSTIDGTYRVLGSLILNQSPSGLVDVEMLKTGGGSTDTFYSTDVDVVESDDPYIFNVSAITTIPSGSFVTIRINGNSARYMSGSVFYVRKIS